MSKLYGSVTYLLYYLCHYNLCLYPKIERQISFAILPYVTTYTTLSHLLYIRKLKNGKVKFWFSNSKIDKRYKYITNNTPDLENPIIYWIKNIAEFENISEFKNMAQYERLPSP